MAKAGSIYYLEGAGEGQRPDTVFVGASWDMKKNPEDPRKVLSFSLKGKDGQTWHKLKTLEFENGIKIDVSDKTLLYKPRAEDAPSKGRDFDFD